MDCVFHQLLHTFFSPADHESKLEKLHFIYCTFCCWMDVTTGQQSCWITAVHYWVLFVPLAGHYIKPVPFLVQIFENFA